MLSLAADAMPFLVLSKRVRGQYRQPGLADRDANVIGMMIMRASFKIILFLSAHGARHAAAKALLLGRRRRTSQISILFGRTIDLRRHATMLLSIQAQVR